MSYNLCANTTAIKVIVGLLAVETIWQIFKRTIGKSSPNKKKNTVINEVLFFSEELSQCRVHAVSRIPCHRLNCSVRSMRKLIAWIDSAERHLDICLYLLSCEDLSKAISRSISRGVIIRVIIDSVLAENNACDKWIREFQLKGIKVRMKKSEYLMHHKFAIIDKELVITGSTNWTMQAFHGNWDNIIISNEKSLVKPFVNEFDKMWTVLTDGED